MFFVQVFEREGIAVIDLPFEDCSPPTLDVVVKFMLVAEALPGVPLVVHCKVRATQAS